LPKGIQLNANCLKAIQQNVTELNVIQLNVVVPLSTLQMKFYVAGYVYVIPFLKAKDNFRMTFSEPFT